MKQNCVVCKGNQYNSGDTMNILWYPNGCKNAHPYTGVFLNCDEEKDEYSFIVDGKTYCYNKICFYQIVLSKDAQKNNKCKKNKYVKEITLKEELNIDGMLIAWIWYLFIMAISIIFKGAIIIWIIASYIFFDYRKTKLKEAGYK